MSYRPTSYGWAKGEVQGGLSFVRKLRSVAAVRDPDDALAMAVRLYRSPGLARAVRNEPLAPDVILVIRVAGGCPVSRARACEVTGLDGETIMRIVSLYLLVALFWQQGDCYRTLGLSADATPDQVQDHKKWLLKWLHPDRNSNQPLAGLSVRVLAASAELARSHSARALGAVSPAQPQPQPLRPAQSPRNRHLRWRWTPLPLNR